MRFQSVLGEVNTVRGWSYPSRVVFANEENTQIWIPYIHNIN